MNTPESRNESAKMGSVVGAAVCWWTALFLILAALTVESLTASPASLRLWVAVPAAVLLAAGFILTYARKPSTRSFRGFRRFNAVMLWGVTAAVAVFVVFPGEKTLEPPARPDPTAPSTAAAKMPPGGDDAQLAGAAKRTLSVGGMVCQACVETVTEALVGVPGVLAADVDLEGGRAVVSASQDSMPPDSTLVNAVIAAGYQARVLSEGNGKADDPAGGRDD